MNDAKFFAALRTSVFKGGLSQPQVAGINAILAACQRNKVTDQHHVAMYSPTSTERPVVTCAASRKR